MHREQMLVFLAIVVVYMKRANARLHDVEFVFNARADVRMTRIENVIQINLLAATSETPEAANQVYNVAVGDRTTLNQLYENLRVNLVEQFPHLANAKPIHRDFRSGDVRHSLADISKAKGLLGYAPQYRVGEGLKEAMVWYLNQHVGSNMQYARCSKFILNNPLDETSPPPARGEGTLGSNGQSGFITEKLY